MSNPRNTIPDIPSGRTSDLSAYVNGVKNTLQDSENQALHFRGNWATDLDVREHDLVLYGGVLWESLTGVVGVTPVAGANWRQVLAGATSGVTRTVTASGPINATDAVIFADATAGNITLTLPAATAAMRPVWVKRTNAGANTVTVQRAGSDTIDGATSKVHTAQWESYGYAPNGSNLWGVF